MQIKLSDYIMEQTISDASVIDIEIERCKAEIDVINKICEAEIKMINMGMIVMEAETNGAASVLGNFGKPGIPNLAAFGGANSGGSKTGSKIKALFISIANWFRKMWFKIAGYMSEVRLNNILKKLNNMSDSEKAEFKGALPSGEDTIKIFSLFVTDMIAAFMTLLTLDTKVLDEVGSFNMGSENPAMYINRIIHKEMEKININDAYNKAVELEKKLSKQHIYEVLATIEKTIIKGMSSYVKDVKKTINSDKVEVVWVPYDQYKNQIEGFVNIAKIMKDGKKLVEEFSGDNINKIGKIIETYINNDAKKEVTGALHKLINKVYSICDMASAFVYRVAFAIVNESDKKSQKMMKEGKSLRNAADADTRYRHTAVSLPDKFPTEWHDRAKEFDVDDIDVGNIGAAVGNAAANFMQDNMGL